MNPRQKRSRWPDSVAWLANCASAKSKAFLLAMTVTLWALNSFTLAQNFWDVNTRQRDTASGFQSARLWQGGDWLSNQQAHPEWQLGVETQNTATGVYIKSVTPGGAANRANIETQDVIVSVNGYQVGMVEDRLYDLNDELNTRADERGVVSLLIQDHRSLRLARVRVQLQKSRQTLRGKVVFRGSGSLPADAIVTVQIDNASRNYYQVRHGQTSFRPSSSEMPFEIAYDPNYIDPNDFYQVRAFVTMNGRTIMDTPQPVRVLTRGNPSNVSLELASFAPPRDNRNGPIIETGFQSPSQVDDRIIQMYRHYLGHDPSPLQFAVLKATTNIEDTLRTLPLELMAAQEYFDRAGNNNQVWIRAVFQEIVGRQIREQELLEWLRRYEELRGSRTELLRQLSVSNSKADR